ncbi:MAG: cupin domain-containing protein [Bacteroidia bacterium]|nr:cupin domain-containing protein [Bacteroidia bacterium]
MKRTIVNPIVKDTVTFLQTAKESGGKITDLELTLLPEGGNVLHNHNYSEKFTAIDGELGLKLGKKQTMILKPGESYTVPAMALHNFFNPTDREIRFGIQVVPGHEGFENMLRILYGLASDGLTDKESKPKSLTHLAIVLCMAELNAPGLLTLMLPIFKIIAKKAKKNGEEQKLIDRYCS